MNDEAQAREEYKKILQQLRENREERAAIVERLEALSHEHARVLHEENALLAHLEVAGKAVLATIERAERGELPVERPTAAPESACDTMRTLGYCDCY